MGEDNTRPQSYYDVPLFEIVCFIVVDLEQLPHLFYKIKKKKSFVNPPCDGKGTLGLKNHCAAEVVLTHI